MPKFAHAESCNEKHPKSHLHNETISVVIFIYPKHSVLKLLLIIH